MVLTIHHFNDSIASSTVYTRRDNANAHLALYPSRTQTRIKLPSAVFVPIHLPFSLRPPLLSTTVTSPSNESFKSIVTRYRNWQEFSYSKDWLRALVDLMKLEEWKGGEQGAAVGC
jgi:hypothetical protein